MFKWLLFNTDSDAGGVAQLPEVITDIVDKIIPVIPVTFAAVTLFTLLWIIRKVQKSQMAIEDAVSWIVWTGAILVILLTQAFEFGRDVLTQFADAIGVASPILLIVVVVVLYLYLKAASLTIKLSKLNGKLEKLTQEYALDNNEDDKQEKVKREYRR